jgi:nitrite reductase (NADH) small subunit
VERATDWRDVGAIDDVPCLGSRVVVMSRGPIAIFRTADDEIFALEDRCPHKAGPLSQGIVHGRHVTCPLHNFVVDLGTGQVVEARTAAAHAWSSCASRVTAFF